MFDKDTEALEIGFKDTRTSSPSRLQRMILIVFFIVIHYRPALYFVGRKCEDKHFSGITSVRAICFGEES